MLGSQRASLYKERLGYMPKKGNVAFVNDKTSFVRNNAGIARAASKLVT
jgi:hypothetical protein